MCAYRERERGELIYSVGVCLQRERGELIYSVGVCLQRLESILADICLRVITQDYILSKIS